MALLGIGFIVAGGFLCSPLARSETPRDAHAAVAASADYPRATEARLAGDERQTRFILELDRKIELRTFALADPYRVVVDVPQVNFQLPPTSGQSGRGLVKAFRFGLVMPGGSRIVMDLTKP